MAEQPTFTRGVWVSYAGVDKNLVYQLTERVAACKDECHFRLHTYLVKDDGEPLQKQDEVQQRIKEDEIEPNLVSFLNPGQRLEDLIKCIGGNMRRALFVSETYLESIYCLKELMCCLIRKPTCNLFIVTIGLAGGFDKALLETKRTYKSFGKKSSIEKELSIAEALTEIYCHNWDYTDKEFCLTELTKEEILDYFVDQLKDLSQRLKLSTKEDFNKWQLHSYKTQKKISEVVHELYKPLCYYVDTFDITEQLNTINEKRGIRLLEWYNTGIGKKVITPYEVLKEWIDNAHNYQEELLNFCVNLEKVVDDKNIEQTKALQLITWILLTVIIPREFAAELFFNTFPNSTIRLAEPEHKEFDKLLNIHVALAAAFNHSLNINLSEDKQYLVANNHIKLPPLGLEENEDLQYKIAEEIGSIISSDMQLSKLIKNNRLKFRSAIRTYMRREKIKAITLVASLSKLDSKRSIAHEAFSEFLEFINKDLKTKHNEPQLCFYVLLLSYSTLQDIEVDEYLASDLTTALQPIFEKYV